MFVLSKLDHQSGPQHLQLVQLPQRLRGGPLYPDRAGGDAEPTRLASSCEANVANAQFLWSGESVLVGAQLCGSLTIFPLEGRATTSVAPKCRSRLVFSEARSQWGKPRTSSRRSSPSEDITGTARQSSHAGPCEPHTWAGATWLFVQSACCVSELAMEGSSPGYHERVGMLVYRRERESERLINYCYLSRNMLRCARLSV